MSKLATAKKIVKEHFGQAMHGIYDCRNWCGDPMITIYDEEGLQIDICYPYEYFEVFGLSNGEFFRLEMFYENLRKGADDESY